MQERHVARIDAAFHRLEVVAFLQAFRGVALLGGDGGEFPFGERWLLVGGTHVDPDHAAALGERIGLELDLLAETAFGGLRRDVDALAGHVVFPAVIGTTQSAFFIAGEE